MHFFYQYLAWSYCGFLHDQKSLEWVRARFLADRIEDYWIDIPSGKRPKETFRLISSHMEKFLCEQCKVIFYIDGVLAESFLQSVWYFADYLLHFGWMDIRDVQEVQSRCLDFHEKCKKVIDDCDAVHILFKDFKY